MTLKIKEVKCRVHHTILTVRNFNATSLLRIEKSHPYIAPFNILFQYSHGNT